MSCTKLSEQTCREDKNCAQGPSEPLPHNFVMFFTIFITQEQSVSTCVCACFVSVFLCVLCIGVGTSTLPVATSATDAGPPEEVCVCGSFLHTFDFQSVFILSQMEEEEEEEEGEVGEGVEGVEDGEGEVVAGEDFVAEGVPEGAGGSTEEGVGDITEEVAAGEGEGEGDTVGVAWEEGAIGEEDLIVSGTICAPSVIFAALCCVFSLCYIYEHLRLFHFVFVSNTSLFFCFLV